MENYQSISDTTPVIEPEKPGCVKRLYPAGFKKELKGVISIAGPMILTQLFQYMIGPVAIMFCGHLGETQLAAVALACSFINVTGITIALGLSSACDTLFSQVYGSTNKKRLGIMLQRSILILLLAVFPCWAIHLNMEALLRLLGQDPEVSRITGEYLLVFMPGVLFFFGYICFSKYLQNQNIVMPNLIIGGISNGVNALLHYLLVIVADLGLTGSAISQALSYFFMMVLTLLYIIIMKVYKETWDGWTWECLREWGEFLRLAAFGLVMLCVEYWSFEIGTVTAGLLGTDYLGGMSVIFQLETFAYMLPLGSGIAASIRVGQFLGAGDAEGAQTAARVTMTSSCVAELGVALIFLTLHNYLPMIFTNVPYALTPQVLTPFRCMLPDDLQPHDQEYQRDHIRARNSVERTLGQLKCRWRAVIALIQNVLIVCAFYQISDGLAGTGAGILRGQGRQNLGALIVFFGYASALGVGTPLMLFTSLRLYAFFGALAIALTVEGVLFALIIHFTDWEGQAKEALARAKVLPTAPIVEVTIQTTNEKLSLIKNGTNGVHHSLSDRSINADTEKANDKLTDDTPIGTIIIRRIIALVFILCIFIGGILLRFLYTNHIEIPLKITPASPTLAGNASISFGISTSTGNLAFTDSL